ncbi:MAG TPA: glycoside hydrolase domain-containing protein, partial [Streptomyces sp.]|nr:glycoside hydrolase domain-containing protein [Streptomyces sp.]
PLVMGSPEYAVGSPQFTKATVHLENGRDLVVKAPKNNARNVYVQGLRVNGKPWHSTSLPHKLIARGGTLEFDMGPTPSRWGTGEKNAPSSITKDGEVPTPPGDLTEPGNNTPLLDNTSGTESAFSEAPMELRPGSRDKTVTSYTLTSAKKGEAPDGWVLQASDDGKKWKAVDRRKHQSFRWDRQTRVFDVAHPGTYKHYRLVPAGESTLAEIELLG